MKKSIEKPRVDRRQLQQIIAGLSEGVVLIDPDASIVWANETALAIHGARNLASLGKTARDYVSAYALKYRNNHVLTPEQYPIMRVLAGECFSDVVVEVTKPRDESFRRMHQVRGLILTNASDEAESLALVIQDVTERFGAEERFERTFNTNPAPAIICRLSDLRYVKVNQGFLEMTGFAREEVIGRSAYELDVLNEAAKREEAIRHLQEGRTIPQMEATLRLHGGETKLVIVAGQPIEVGEEACMLFTFMDLEPRKRAEDALRQTEERFSKAFMLAPVPMTVSSLEGFLLMDVNEAFVETTGYDAEEILAKDAVRLKLWADEATQRRLRAKLEVSGSLRNEEVRLRTRGGEVLDCLLSAETVSIHGQPCVLTAIQDITERKRSEEELVAAIDAVMQDASWFSRTVIEKLAQIRRPQDAQAGSPQLSDLTPREHEVLGLMCQGEDNEQIAKTLQLSPNTVRNHIATLYSKIGVHRRSDAIVWARQRGVTGYEKPGNGTKRHQNGNGSG
ncbi:helix-turn-helix transcriptional regulator [Pigmentiphaga sp. NML080357]|uniref:helix-turn-helix transcriptional regulator n=1 Tax=Pigmentiphaga sp. NML080357 TaxID=2008675 RepID=UPI000B408880|nr:helix-turn-helix transcriptional regulator [Pigmentiphaga sp. NML080357]OVZ55087.1 helix-turn-helix transcriptional regulator [Pigmentiphaga sp. NML080357]